MDFRQQLVGVRPWLPRIAVGVVAAALFAYFVSGLLPKTYEATTKLVVGQSLSSVDPEYSNLLAAQRLATTYATVATTVPQLTKVIVAVPLAETPEELGQRVHAEAAIDSSLLTIVASDGSAATAARIANQLAEELIAIAPELSGQQMDLLQTVREDMRLIQTQIAATQAEIETLLNLEDPRTPAQEQRLTALEDRVVTLRATYSDMLTFASADATNQLTIVEPAIPPADPVSPRPFLNAALAAILATLIGIAIVAMAMYLDTRLRTPEELREVAGLPTLGTVSTIPMPNQQRELYRLVTLVAPRSAPAESYRMLRTNLEFASIDDRLEALLVTSAMPQEGKTVTASNLAVVLAQAGRNVILVDADLRKPGVHGVFNLENALGLTNLLRSPSMGIPAVLQATDQENLRVVASGPTPPNPAELLGTQRMRAVLEDLRRACDVLVIDSPPLQVVTDAAILSTMADGTLLVVDSSRTRRDDVRHAAESLARAGVRVVGAVLNRLPEADPATYGGYYGVAQGVPADGADAAFRRTAT